MLDKVDLQKVRPDNEVKVLDQALWQAWMSKNASREQHATAKRLIAVKCLSIVVLAATALFWGETSEYDFWIRFGVSLGALVVLFQALQSRRYAVAAAFAVLVVVYNPVVPAFPFTGPGPRTVVLLTMLPFTASLIWLRQGRPARENSLATIAGA